jgi:autotransporter-associated beta strand protein
MTGSGALTLAGSNSYSGGTRVGGGTLQLGNNSALGNGGLTADAGTVDLASYSPFVLALSGSAGTITNSGSEDSLLTVDQAGQSTFSGTIANGPTNRVALAISGPGTLILAGSDSYTGGTDVSEGTLILASRSAIVAGTSLTVGADATLLFNSPLSSSRSATPLTASDVTAVPEPGTLSLLAVGLAIVFGASRKIRRFPR